MSTLKTGMGVVFRDEDGAYTLLDLINCKASSITPGRYTTLPDNKVDVVSIEYSLASSEEDGAVVLNSSHGVSFFEDEDQMIPAPAHMAMARIIEDPVVLPQFILTNIKQMEASKEPLS